MKPIEETHPSLIKAVSRYKDEYFINVYKEEIQETTVDKAVLKKRLKNKKNGLRRIIAKSKKEKLMF